MLKNINLDKLLKKWSNQELWNMVFSFWWSKPNWSMKHWLTITLLDFSMTLDYWDSLLTQELLTTKLVELFTNSLTTILMGDCLLIHIISDQGMLNNINLDKLMLFDIMSSWMCWMKFMYLNQWCSANCHCQYSTGWHQWK